MEMRQKEYIKNIEDEYEKINYSAWLHGQYMIPAIQVSLSPKTAKYPDSPFSNKEEVQSHPEVQARQFEDWADAFNKKFEQHDGA